MDALLAAVAAARHEGRTIVQCHGCFDIVHPGHIRYLEFARRQGDLLVVTLTGDAAFTKRDQGPYIPEELRAENLAALLFVDYVCIDPNPTAEHILALVKPDLYVKGREYENSDDPGFLAEKRTVEQCGGRIVFSSGEIVFSSTKLIERMPAAPELEAERLSLLCQRYDISTGLVYDLLQRFRNLRLLVVGDIVVDRYVFCDVLGVAHESPMMSLARLEESEYLGGAAIVARHAVALGARPFLLSCGGSDAGSTRALELLRKEGVEVELLPSRPGLVEKTRFLADENKLFKVDMGERLPLDSTAERRAARVLEAHARGADAAVFCDFGYGMITGGLLSRTLPMLRHNVGVLAADVSGGRATLLNFEKVDLLCPTEREVRAVLNDYDSGLSAVAWQTLARTQARHLLVTLEKRGLVVFQRRNQQPGTPGWSGRLKSEQLPSFAEYAVDGLGCGDALLATSTLALAAGATLMQAAYLGNAAAALEAGRLGNHPISQSALREWLRPRRELTCTVLARHRTPAAVPVG
ncbi:MAG TPA: PfkB family carbohydrate kinase [Phycisphaerae bacterium]|nr:PfkB family carbohydrate kinase [Phycisphaerae bacterium]HNU45163.1 PfkB family carbohydrate kinase [Phycisphaerae bacterium]